MPTFKYEVGGELPPGSISFSDMSWHRTGDWRYLKPRFVRKPSPCCEACPAGTDVEEFLYLAGVGRYSEALDKILQENPFPGVCGRVCYHPCESACNRKSFDESVAIQALERFVAGFADRADRASGDGKTVRKGSRCRSGTRGAVLRVSPGEIGLPGHRLRKERRTGRDPPLWDTAIPPSEGHPGRRNPTDRGLRDRNQNRLPGGAGYFVGGPFLLRRGFRGHGGSRREGSRYPRRGSRRRVSGAFFPERVSSGEAPGLGKKVAIVGGGNTAIDCARTALRLGSDPVIVYRRTREEMPAIASEVDEAAAEGVSMEWLTAPVAVVVKDGRVKGLKCIRTVIEGTDADGRPAFKPVAGSEFVLDVGAVITATGEVLSPEDAPEGVAMDDGVMRIDSWGRTSSDNVWAGGDAATDPRMVVHAIGAGKRAAMAIHARLSGADIEALEKDIRTGEKGSFSMERRVNGKPAGAPYVNEVVRWEDLNPEYFELKERTAVAELPPKKRAEGFDEVCLGFDEAQAAEEAGRCFHCGACDLCGNCFRFCPDLSVTLGDAPGANEFNEFYCKGCGICAEECPRAAIVMEEER